MEKDSHCEKPMQIYDRNEASKSEYTHFNMYTNNFGRNTITAFKALYSMFLYKYFFLNLHKT